MACVNHAEGPSAAECGCAPQPQDTDGDGFADGADNCPQVANATQLDTDNDGIGDACEAGPCCSGHIGGGCEIPECQTAVCAFDAYCCNTAWDSCCAQHARQMFAEDCACGAPTTDNDGDGVANAVDNCPGVANPDQLDADADADADAERVNDSETVLLRI